MLEVSTALRDAYLTLLENLEVDGVLIPVYDEEFPSGGDQASLGGAFACYVLLANQTENDVTPFCQFQQDCSIQVQIVTKFPKATGGKFVSEQISNEILQIIYPNPSGCVLDLGNDFEAVNTKKESAFTKVDNNLTNTVYTKILIFSHLIAQT
jgi:hypothetical protein